MPISPCSGRSRNKAHRPAAKKCPPPAPFPHRLTVSPFHRLTHHPPSPPLALPLLIFDRISFSFSRRSRLPFVGFVRRLTFGSASAITSISRNLAMHSALLRDCDRS